MRNLKNKYSIHQDKSGTLYAGDNYLTLSEDFGTWEEFKTLTGIEQTDTNQLFYENLLNTFGNGRLILLSTSEGGNQLRFFIEQEAKRYELLEAKYNETLFSNEKRNELYKYGNQKIENDFDRNDVRFSTDGRIDLDTKNIENYEKIQDSLSTALEGAINRIITKIGNQFSRTHERRYYEY